MSANWSLYEAKLKINGNTFKEQAINDFVKSVNKDFSLNLSYEQVYINGSSTVTEVQIVDDYDDTSNLNESKIIIMKPYEKISKGAIVQWNSEFWVCILTEPFSNVYYKGKIVYCADTNVIIPDTTANISKYISIPYIIINNPTITLDQNNYFEIQDGKLSIQVPSNINTLAMYVGMRIILGKLNVWKITGINDVYSVGFLKLDLEKCEKDGRDDFINGIAWNEKVITNSYKLSVLSGSDISFSTSQTSQINIQVKNNNVVVSPTPSLTYSSSDVSVCTVNSNGNITGVGAGSAVVTCALTSDESVKATVNVEIVASVQNNYAANITGYSQIIKNHTSSYSVIFTDNGSQIVRQSQFYITEDDGITPVNDTIALIQSQDSTANKAVVQVKSPSGIVYIKLFAKSSDNLIVSDGFRIKIASLI